MSRKIDALVAEKVMGKRYWKELRAKHYLAVAEHNGREPWTSRRLEHQEKERYTPITAMEAVSLGFWGDSDRNLPRYSTDIASAWELVEKFNGTRYTIVVTAWGSNTYSASLWDGEKCRELDSGNRDSAPLSICLVALRAVGVTESEIEAARNQTKGTQ